MFSWISYCFGSFFKTLAVNSVSDLFCIKSHHTKKTGNEECKIHLYHGHLQKKKKKKKRAVVCKCLQCFVIFNISLNFEWKNLPRASSGQGWSWTGLIEETHCTLGINALLSVTLQAKPSQRLADPSTLYAGWLAAKRGRSMCCITPPKPLLRLADLGNPCAHQTSGIGYAPSPDEISSLIGLSKDWVNPIAWLNLFMDLLSQRLDKPHQLIKSLHWLANWIHPITWPTLFNNWLIQG